MLEVIEECKRDIIKMDQDEKTRTVKKIRKNNRYLLKILDNLEESVPEAYLDQWMVKWSR